MRSLIYHPGAKTDLAAAILFYRREGGVRLSERFMRRVQAAIDKILSDPTACPEVDVGIRRQRVWKFPFDIIFTEAGDKVTILAASHQARDPDYWISRKSDE
ncbi:MAG: type II toxin-antitoxin system RelE/ParE family toxin [Candidatus Saccharimonas sp.]|nr:type II toxin-antitoxin system RelE/ParE family toxin [Planctomycetaceae bacterium]